MIAFTFPGQGSQQPGMGAPWLSHPSWELVGEASAQTGRDIGALLLEADAETLRDTRNAQVATFVLSLVILDAVERLGVVPARLAGHSLGEYSALAASGALSFEDGVRLVNERGAAMAVAAEERPGTMRAVLGLDDDQVEVACVATEGDVWVANYNAPGQVVVAGEPDAVDRAVEAAKRLGAKRALPLPVAGAFHTPLMGGASDRLEKAVQDARLRDPEVPVLANVDAGTHTEAASWADLLVEQLVKPVRWRQILHAMEEEGATVVAELGPGNALTGMARRTLDDVTTVSVQQPADLDTLLEALSGELHASSRPNEGEQVHITERVVVSPAAGIFHPHDAIADGARLEPGDLVGTVGDEEVRTPFAGSLMGYLAASGERIQPSQPVAWLRSGT